MDKAELDRFDETMIVLSSEWYEWYFLDALLTASFAWRAASVLGNFSPLCDGVATGMDIGASLAGAMER